MRLRPPPSEICHYCFKPFGQGMNSKTRDYKIPKSRGGLTTFSNLVWAHLKCNTDKGHLTDGEYFAVLNFRRGERDATIQGPRG